MDPRTKGILISVFMNVSVHLIIFGPVSLSPATFGLAIWVQLVLVRSDTIIHGPKNRRPNYDVTGLVECNRKLVFSNKLFLTILNDFIL